MNLTLHDELRLRQVQVESDGLSQAEMQECLLRTWKRWLQERRMLLELVEAETGIRMEVESNHCTPRSLLAARR